MNTFLGIIVFFGFSFLCACLVRKFGNHTLINGLMSKEMADEVFPFWRKKENDQKKSDQDITK